VQYFSQPSITVKNAFSRWPPSLLRAADQLGDPRDGGRAEDQVDVGRALLDPALLQLRHAAHDPDDQIRPLALEMAQDPQLREDLVFSFLSDRAGIEQDQVGVFRAIRELVPLLLEQAGHSLGVILVHLAAVGDEVELGHQSENSREGKFRITVRDLR
jgi:hypothetical protein